ncbi:hypothetical protein AAFF_G00275690 [Aldrovandia affinis]|uniref:Uncharacterized protein n=1 Tax=Aldrovandia affinis TaxID=143900 RepID=A0AAD7W2L6_9TELE|nr:hypothetical protein AAFF_G00275690 [Aldrovandia affinis]
MTFACDLRAIGPLQNVDPRPLRACAVRRAPRAVGSQPALSNLRVLPRAGPDRRGEVSALSTGATARARSGARYVLTQAVPVPARTLESLFDITVECRGMRVPPAGLTSEFPASAKNVH